MLRIPSSLLRPTPSTLAGLCLAAVLPLALGCNKAKAPAALTPAAAAAPSPAGPSEADMRAAREALSVNDVVAQLRAGVPKEKVLEAVQRRHLASIYVSANELELAANGADHTLLVAMKDPRNLITPAQEAAYMQFTAERARKPKPPLAAR